MSVNARACLFTRASARALSLSPPTLAHSFTGILIICTDEITAYDVAAARRCIIPRVAMAYKRNLRLMQRALPPSLALSLSLSLSAARVVSSLQPRLDRFSRPYATSGLTFRPATSQPDS